MEQFIFLLYLIVGGVVLTYGAHLFVESASHLAKRAGVSPLVIGLTIVSIGTSAPEFAVNVMAAAGGKSDIAMGNVVGSNIFNTLFILGLCGMIVPLYVSKQLIKIDMPLMLVSSLLCWFFGRDGVISREEAFLFLVAFIGYNILQFQLSKKEKSQLDDEFKKEFSNKGQLLKDALKLVSGIVLLVLGAKLFVDGATIAARFLGLSEAVIGLTVVSIGTSLPELATSVVASLKGEKDIAIGNVVGSNIFNILGVLGASGIVAQTPLVVSTHMAQIDIVVMTAAIAACVPFALWRKKIERPIAFLLLSSYCAYTYYLITIAG
jgi:cation:H+ antiporter